MLVDGRQSLDDSVKSGWEGEGGGGRERDEPGADVSGENMETSRRPVPDFGGGVASCGSVDGRLEPGNAAKEALEKIPLTSQALVLVDI